eukprot:NODE_1015_length_629_cov_556.451724_g943_i0.p2 GENE.NODE_1015_length_629_cov_556.451724_g943_i0~~NODE_1015_length_629_cov_556.451724_g943_i0.p2  ORF type:complete len:154 (-),score=21.15 NODE_1015_length_629_cov_556.451724_g943_i0:98-559(-)
MVHSFGLRGGTRDLFSKAFRKHGRPSVGRYLNTFRVGQYVDVVADAAIQKGMPHKAYQGKTGKVWNVTPRAVGVIIHKKIGSRFVRKRLCIRTEHVRASQCQKDHKVRVALAAQGKHTKRKPVGRAGSRTVKTSQVPQQLGQRAFDFAEHYGY